jgi:hypothetical protein
MGFYSEACTVLFCLMSLLWIFVVSHDWTPSDEVDSSNMRSIRADPEEPVFLLVLVIGVGMMGFTVYTLRKVSTHHHSHCRVCFPGTAAKMPSLSAPPVPFRTRRTRLEDAPQRRQLTSDYTCSTTDK